MSIDERRRNGGLSATSARSLLGRRVVLVGVVVGVPVSLLFLWLAARDADLEQVWATLQAARVAPVALALVAIGCVYLGQALRWRKIARTPGVRLARYWEMVISGVAVNNVLPGRIGDLLRARWLQVAARIRGGTALSTVFVDRAFDVLALVVLLAVSLPFVASAEWLTRIAIGGVLLLAGILAVLAVARVYTRRRPRERRSRGLVRRIVRDLLEGLSDPLGRRRGIALAGVSLATWGVWAVAAWLVARGVGIELSPIEAVFVTGVINLGVAIPSSPGFIGTYQWLGVSALALLDVPTDEALAFSILMHAVWYVPTLVVGFALLARRWLHAIRSASPRSAQLGEAADG